MVWAGAICGIALAYVCIIRIVGHGLYCPFWMLTGSYCPGCGVSRMCLRLLRLDFAGAFRANRLLFICLPLILGLLAARALRYIRTGERETPRWEEGIWLALAGLFLLYGVARNLPAFSFLAPM